MIESIPPSSHRLRLAELDALRGLAALAVLLFHFTTRYQAMYGHVGTAPPGLPWGYHGVELFFAISGFVIFVTLDHTRTLADFAVSRLSRLFPAYWTAILLTTLMLWLSGHVDRMRAPQDILVNLTMLQAYLRVPAVDDVYWTLAVELAFYLMMAAIWRLGLFRRFDLVLAAWLSLPWIWTFLPVLTGHEPSWMLGLLLVQEQIPWFAIGIVAYRLRRDEAARSSWALLLLALGTIAACRGLAMLGVAIVVTLAMLIVALRGWSLLRFRPLVWLGGISYSLYLLHQGIGHVLIGRLEAHGVAPVIAVPIATAGMILLAAIVTARIERPALAAIRSAWRRRARHGPGGPLPAAPAA